MVGLDSDDESDGTSTLQESRTNKHGLKLTKSGRPSIKKNEVNTRYSTKYRSPSNQQKILGKSLSITKACAIIGTVMFGPEISLEDAGHDDRLRIFKAAAFYCLDDEALADILETQEAVLRHFVKGIFQAAVRVMRYELAAAARLYFEVNVFKPARRNAEIQKHLGLEMVQSVFDQYIFANKLCLHIFCIISNRCCLPLSGFQILRIRSCALGQTRKIRRPMIM